MSLKEDLLGDLDDFLDSDEFAVPVAITGGATVFGIFDDEYRAMNIQDGQVASSGPQVICKSTDVAALALGTVVTIKSVAYKVIEKQPDGTGLTTLILSKD